MSATEFGGGRPDVDRGVCRVPRLAATVEVPMCERTGRQMFRDVPLVLRASGGFGALGELAVLAAVEHER